MPEASVRGVPPPGPEHGRRAVPPCRAAPPPAHRTARNEAPAVLAFGRVPTALERHASPSPQHMSRDDAAAPVAIRQPLHAQSRGMAPPAKPVRDAEERGAGRSAGRNGAPPPPQRLQACEPGGLLPPPLLPLPRPGLSQPPAQEGGNKVACNVVSSIRQNRLPGRFQTPQPQGTPKPGGSCDPVGGRATRRPEPSAPHPARAVSPAIVASIRATIAPVAAAAPASLSSASCASCSRAATAASSAASMIKSDRGATNSSPPAVGATRTWSRARATASSSPAARMPMRSTSTVASVCASCTARARAAPPSSHRAPPSGSVGGTAGSPK
eukprot:scaffold10284_cov118-Isochrysis_galbana.AAC.8